MYYHFDSLTQLYLETKNSNMLKSSTSCDTTSPDEELRTFGKTLSHITQYHRLKTLATLQYTAGDMLSTSNVVSSIAFDKDNEFFAIAGVPKKIQLYDYINVIGCCVESHSPTAELSCDDKVSCVAWNNYYKNSLASADYSGTVSIWDVTTCARVQRLDEHENRTWSVDWSNGNPRLLASGSDDYKVKLWQTDMSRSALTLETNANVCCVQFCPESTHVIAFGSADHHVHYYDLRNYRQPLGILKGHKKAVSYVKFVSKGQLVSASTDNNLKLWKWDVNQSMSCVRSFTGHINEKNFVGLDTDGDYMASGSEDNSVYLYHKDLTKPLFSFKFEKFSALLGSPKRDGSQDFVSAVAWKKGSPVVVAANSQGDIKVLQMV